ncbi:MAG: hypothetical protein ACRDNO_08880, partial [Trebonia sp.]
MTGSQDAIDAAEAQCMLDAFRGAVVHAEDAEDRVLLHRGLLTPVEAGRRAALRRPVPAGAEEPPRTGLGVRHPRHPRRPRRVRRG